MQVMKTKKQAKQYTLCCVCGNKTEKTTKNKTFTGEYVCECQTSYEHFAYMRMNE